MRIYRFFLECSKRETIKERKLQLEMLGLGKCGMILDNENGPPILVKDRAMFVIPETYSDEERNKLNKILWGDDTDFYKMEKEIKESIKNWENVKKRDKLRIIDKYVLQLKCDLKEKKLIKSVITIALILRMIQSNDIIYKDYEITNIEGTFDCEYFSKISEDTASKSARSNSCTTKISAKDIWKKVCDNKTRNMV